MIRASGKLTRCAREVRQHQNALLVIAGGDEFLGDEVHAVVQARDDADIGRAEQFEHLTRFMMADDELHGLGRDVRRISR